MLSLPPDALLLVAVGRQVKRKGVAWFVANVLPRVGNARLAIAGEGPEMDAIREAAAQAGVSARIHVLGRIGETELRRLLVAGDLFVMPNIPVPGDMEGFGVVMLEAGLAGLPTVASDLEGIRDVVSEGANGHLIPPLNADAFAERLSHYDADRAALARMADSARSYVARTFTWPAVADQYVGVLERLVDSASSRTGGPAVGRQELTTDARLRTL
jgi:phosphatidylinositol alpha-1,6-mannosyltransferase